MQSTPNLLLILLTAGLTDCASNLLAPRSFCGYQHTDDYNRDDQRITLDEFPWIAQLLYDDDKSVKCTGSLINNRYVLTAAHCLKLLGPVLTRVRLGDFNVTSDRDCVSDEIIGKECSDPVEDFDIEEQIPHPKYRRRPYEHDIGLIRLSRDVAYSEYIRPICLPLSKKIDLKEGEQLAVSGWGYLVFEGTPTQIKKKVITTLVSIEKCNEFYKRDQRLITDANLCAMENETYTCQGDSGGPLMHSAKHQWEQVGIMEYRSHCGLPIPSVYINVASYLDWIDKNLRK